MNLQEINSVRQDDPAGLDGWLSVPPRFTYAPSEIRNCWVFPNGKTAAAASTSSKSFKIARQLGDFVSYYKTMNGIYILLQMSTEAAQQLVDCGNLIYAFNITEKSCRDAGLKAWRLAAAGMGIQMPLVFQVPHSDPAYFDKD